MKLLDRDFLMALSEEEGSHEMLTDYMVNDGMTFHDAVIKIADHFNVTPVYYQEK